MIELVVPIHPALEDLWRLFEPSAPSAGTDWIFVTHRSVWDTPETKRLRRWHGYLGRLHRARQDCPHAEVLRVMWVDWTVTPLCADCGHQGRPLRTPEIGDTLLIPRDIEELFAITGLRSLGPDFFFP